MEELKNRFDHADAAEQLELMKAEIHLPNLAPPDGIDEIIKGLSNQEYIRSLDIATICDHMVLLASYMLFLTIYENRVASYFNWCESNIKYIVGKNLDQVPVNYFTEKDWYIRSHEDNAIKLEAMKLTLQVKLDTLKNLGFKLNTIYDALKAMQLAKLKIGSSWQTN